jgi:hypothetical protein
MVYKLIVYGDQQFNQYQEKEQSPLTWTQEKPRHVTLEIQDLVWDRHNIVASLKNATNYKQLLYFCKSDTWAKY